MIYMHGRNKMTPDSFPQGCSWVRIHDSPTPAGGCNWGQIHTAKGVFNWAGLDARIAECKAHGVKVHYVISNTPSWTAQPVAGAIAGLQSPLGNCPGRIEDLTDFVEALMDHAGDDIDSIEPGNEVNYPGFYCGTQDQLLSAVEAIWAVTKAYKAEILVTSPSVVYSYPANTVLTALPPLMAAGFARFADAIAIHGYLADGAYSTAIGPVLDGVHGILTHYGCGLPVWDTEWGFKGNGLIPDAQKAVWVQDALNIRRDKGVALAGGYQWDNDTHMTMYDATAKALTIAGQAWMGAWNAR